MTTIFFPLSLSLSPPPFLHEITLTGKYCREIYRRDPLTRVHPSQATVIILPIVIVIVVVVIIVIAIAIAIVIVIYNKFNHWDQFFSLSLFF